MQSLFLYLEGDSLLHRLDPRSKGIVILSVLAFILLFVNPLMMLIAFLSMVLILWIFGRIPPWQYANVLLLFLPLILGVTIIQGVTNHPPDSTILFTFWILRLSDKGLYLGLSIGLRLATMGLTFLMFAMTTAPNDVGLGLYKVGVPYKYAYLATFGLRFLPLMQENLLTIRYALAARGDPNVFSWNIFRRFLSAPQIFFTLMAKFLRRSSSTAIALELRGYGSQKKRTTVYDLAFKPSDYVVNFIAIVVFLLTLMMKFQLST